MPRRCRPGGPGLNGALDQGVRLGYPYVGEDSMPVIITFDIEGAPSGERNRIQSFFERLGWENLGGSSYRYPRLGTDDQPVEDWFNHVVPALTLFRSYALKSGRKISKFTIDVQASSGHNPATNFGAAPLPGAQVKLYQPRNPAFAKKRLVKWLDDLNFPY